MGNWIGPFTYIIFAVVFVLWLVSVISKRKNRSPEEFDEYGFINVDDIEQISCKNCGMPYDADCPKCPHCWVEGSPEYDVKFCRNCKNTYEPRFKICPYCMTEGWIEKEEKQDEEWPPI